VKKSGDNWAWEETTFPRWRSAVNRRLRDIYVITIDDAGIDNEMLTSHWQMKQSPYAFVECYGIKYDLDPKNAFGV
jgi:DNA-binding transcriptional MocR family regulator